MSLRANTYVALTGAVFLAIALIFAVTLYAGREMIHGVERNLAQAEMRQVAREVDAELRSVDAVAHDWGSWDDADDFVLGKNPGFVAANDPDASLKQLDCDALVILDIRGNRVLETYSPKLEHDASAVATLHSTLGPGSKLLFGRSANPTRGMTGVVGTGSEALLVASRPIVTSSETGPIGGTVVFARLLDSSVLDHISSVSAVSLKAMAPSSGSIPAQVRAALLTPPLANSVDIVVRRPLDITAYLRLGGIDGHPALVLSSVIAPANYEMAMRTITALVGVLLVGGLLWSLVAFWVVDRTSLSRIAWLRDAMARIGEGGELSERIGLPDGRRDEAANVAVAVNKMLDALDSSQERVRESEERHRVLVENMADAVFTLSPDGVFTFANPQAAMLTGISLERLVGMRYESVLAEESVPAVAERLADLSAPAMAPVAVMFSDGSRRAFPVELSISPVRDVEGRPVATTWIARDITERREFEDKLVYLASHDHLTNLLNRRRFEEEVASRLAEAYRHAGHGALLWLDLDHFKQVNDSFGHRAGDELLVRVGGVLRERSREGSVLARIGGDEFAILLPGADEDEAVRAAERVLAELVALSVDSDALPVRVGASAGVALYPLHASTVDELLLRADTAMYSAKEGGRNRVCVFSPDEAWPERILARRGWAERIESAIAADAFVAYAQPILDLHTGSVSDYELLVRMVDSDGFPISPAEFLPVAEDLGLIAEVDRCMVRRAVALLSIPGVRASGARLFVNLSAKTIADPTFPVFAREQFESAGIDARQVGFELTETALVANMARANHHIAELRALGCSFALDDFGTGFSSITYLRHMPVDVLKIDGGLVSSMLGNEQDRHLVFAIVELATCLGIAVTGEFVENEETLALLREAGADFAQGYHIGVPLPATDVLAETARTGGGDVQ